jgi:hypothetical protein
VPPADPSAAHAAAGPGASAARTAALLLGLLVLVLVLSVWAAFLVPLRVGATPAPVWVLPLVAGVAASWLAARRTGLLVVALVPAAAWMVLSWWYFARPRSEGDLVVPASVSGYAYLLGGTLAWAVVVLSTSSRQADRRAEAAASPRSSPRR